MRGMIRYPTQQTAGGMRIGFHPRSHKMDHGPRFPPKFMVFTARRNQYCILQQPKQKIASRTEVDFCLSRFSFYVPDHDENEPVLWHFPAAPPPLSRRIWHHGSRVCLPPMYMNNIHPSDVLPSPLLAEIFTWDGVREVRRRVLRIRTLHPRVNAFDAAALPPGRPK